MSEELERNFAIFELDDGLLKHPVTTGYYSEQEHVFNQYGYTSRELAEQAIIDYKGYGQYIILEFTENKIKD